MKKITLMAVTLLFTGFSFAQVTLQNNDGDMEVTGTNSVGCGTDNNWGRNFTLSEFDIPENFTIASGAFGIQSMGDATDVVVNVYSSVSFFDETDLVLLGSQVLEIDAGATVPGAVEFIFDTPILVPDGTEAVFMELTDVGGSFFVGGTAGNTGGASPAGKGSWLKSVTCGVEAYLTAEEIGFPDAQFYLTLTGDAGLGLGDNDFVIATVYPNPATSVINISVSSSVELKSAVLSDILGKNTGLALVNGSINIADLAAGVYILNVETSNGSLTKKIIKK
jgi:hypothetical protein